MSSLLRNSPLETVFRPFPSHTLLVLPYLSAQHMQLPVAVCLSSVVSSSVHMPMALAGANTTACQVSSEHGGRHCCKALMSHSTAHRCKLKLSQEESAPRFSLFGIWRPPGGVGGLHTKGWGFEKFSPSLESSFPPLETKGKQALFPGYPWSSAGISGTPRGVQKHSRKKKVVLLSQPLKTGWWEVVARPDSSFAFVSCSASTFVHKPRCAHGVKLATRDH